MDDNQQSPTPDLDALAAEVEARVIAALAILIEQMAQENGR